MEDKSIDMERIAEAEVIDTKHAFDIIVVNPYSGCKSYFYVTEENWLLQVLEGTLSELGFRSDIRHTYYRNENDRTTNDGTVTIGEFGLREGSILYIEQDAWL